VSGCGAGAGGRADALELAVGEGLHERVDLRGEWAVAVAGGVGEGATAVEAGEGGGEGAGGVPRTGEAQDERGDAGPLVAQAVGVHHHGGGVVERLFGELGGAADEREAAAAVEQELAEGLDAAQRAGAGEAGLAAMEGDDAAGADDEPAGEGLEVGEIKE
jgi:hypothetical protein